VNFFIGEGMEGWRDACPTTTQEGAGRDGQKVLKMTKVLGVNKVSIEIG